MATLAVFPSSLPGFSINVKRESSTEVDIATAASGKELRSTWQQIPRYKYQVGFELLRNTSKLEAQTLWDHFTRVFGQLQSFLFADPDDNAVTAHGFGTGDGTTTAFQLQRRLLGIVNDQLGSASATSPTSRTNSVLRSQALASTPWVAATLTPTNNAAIAPDGTTTGTTIVGAGAGTLTQPVGAASASGPSTFSVWVQASASTPVALSILDTTSSSTVATQITQLAAGGWQRLQLTGSVTSGHSISVQIGLPSSGTVNAWGAQFELAAAATQYIVTAAAALTLAPSFWPQYSDGFEPIYDVNYGGSAFAVYVNGVAQTPGSGFNVSSSGLVSFASAPALNTKLTWAGSYFRRVRFGDKSLKSDRIVASWYEAKQINLQSLIGS